jgi:hypothetical protein
MDMTYFVSKHLQMYLITPSNNCYFVEFIEGESGVASTGAESSVLPSSIEEPNSHLAGFKQQEVQYFHRTVWRNGNKQTFANRCFLAYYFYSSMSHVRRQYMANYLHRSGSRRNQSIDDGGGETRSHVKRSNHTVKDEEVRKIFKVVNTSFWLVGLDNPLDIIAFSTPSSM